MEQIRGLINEVPSQGAIVSTDGSTSASTSLAKNVSEFEQVAMPSLAEVTRPSISTGISYSRLSSSNRSNSRRNVWSGMGREDSQRSVLSNESLHDCVVDAVSITASDEETMRMVGQAQEEELIQYALERSMSEFSSNSQAVRVNLDESQSSPRPVKRQLMTASAISRSSLPSASSFRSASRPSSRSSCSEFVHPSNAFQRAASERLGLRSLSDAVEFFDLSPRDEPEFRHVVRGLPPSLAGSDCHDANSSFRDGETLSLHTNPSIPLNLGPIETPVPTTTSAVRDARYPMIINVRGPAPKVKPAGRSSSAGFATSVPQPALTEKSEEVRAVIKAHLTSSCELERPSVASSASIRPDSPDPPALLARPIKRNSPTTEEARRAVLEIAKLHLPPMEAHFIEEALQQGARHHQDLQKTCTHNLDNPRPAWQVPTQPKESVGSSVDWPTPSEHAQRVSVVASDFPNIGTISAEELRSIEQALRDSNEPHDSGASFTNYKVHDALTTLTEEELREIQQALDNAPAEYETSHSPYDDEALQSSDESHATKLARDLADENEAIAYALRKADEEEDRKSIELALRIQQEELQYKAADESTLGRQRQQQGHVRVMTRAEYELQGLESVASRSQAANPTVDDDFVASGYRINSTTQQQWYRRDHNSIVGPNQEVRTKHDTMLNGQANAHRLGLDLDDDIAVGNQAFNSFLRSVQTTHKGPAFKGSERTGSDTKATRGGGMDLTVRGHISKAISNNLIEKCNGVVKEGKEAVIYHADRGSESGGFDVAIKVFKKIQEFRSRGDYVDGDPRYGKSTFRNLSNRDQLMLWAEKEFRNLMRAHQASVPVPVPLDYNDNIVFMRFLGADGWPSPQIRELELRKGSSRWNTLYAQVLEAVKRLYHEARLVHGDLSEYNILVVPRRLLDAAATTNADSTVDELHVAIIDFGQAVDVNHPSANILLERDLDRVLQFFSIQGVETMTQVEALSFMYDYQ